MNMVGTPHQGQPSFAGEKRIRSVCFICGWNEGRSAHLELSVRHRLRAAGCGVRVSSAGLRQGGTVNALRREYLRSLGIPCEEMTRGPSASPLR